MPIFRVKDNVSGITLDVQGDGDTPPSDNDLEQIFRDYHESQPPETPAAPKVSKTSAMRQAIGRTAQGLSGAIAATPEAIGIGGTKIADATEAMGLGRMDSPKTPEETVSYKLGRRIRKFYADTFPVDENRPKSFFADTLPSAAGSMAGFILGGAAGKLAKIPAWLSVAATGAASGGAEGYDESKQAGGSDSQNWTSFLINAGLGTTEAIPIANWLTRTNRATGGAIKHAIIEGSEEALQEIFQQVGSNINASKIAGYDPKRPWYEGSTEGGAAGLTLGTLGSLIFGRHGHTPKQGMRQAVPETMADAVERRQAQNTPVPPAEPTAAEQPPVSNVAVPPIQQFANGIGWTVRGLNQGAAFAIPTPEKLAAMSPEDQGLYAELNKQQGKQWDLTDNRPESPTRGLTFYVPENASPAEMKSLYDVKMAREAASQNPKGPGAISGVVKADDAARVNLPAQTPAPPVAAPAPEPAASPARTAVVSTGKPKGTQAQVEYDIVEANELRPMIVRSVGEAQTRQRVGNVASDEQVAQIATNPDLNMLFESNTSMSGAPVIDDVILAGNARTLGIIAGYDGRTKGSITYRNGAIQAGKRLGIDASNMSQPVLVRRVKGYQNGDRRSFVVESNPKYGALKETVAEAALLDADALGDVSSLDFNTDGRLSAPSLQLAAKRLEDAQRGLVRTTGGDFDANEANRRVQLGTLAKMARESNVEVADLIGLIESDDGRRVMSEMTKAAPRLARFDSDIQIGGRLLQAMREFQRGIAAVREGAYNSLEEWNAERRRELFKTELMPLSEAALEMMVERQKRPTALRDFLTNYINLAENEQAKRNEAKQTADIFGQKRQAVSADQIAGRLIPAIEQNRGQAATPSVPTDKAATPDKIVPPVSPVVPAAASPAPVVPVAPISENKPETKPPEPPVTPSEPVPVAETKPEAKEPFAVGSKVRVGKNPTKHTIIRETTDKKFPDERIFEVQNDNTDEKFEVDASTLTQVEDRSGEPKAKKAGKKELQERLLKLNPAYRPTINDYSIAELKALIKREQAKQKGDEPAANLGNGLPEGKGWDEEGVTEAVAKENTAGFRVNVIDSQEAVDITGLPEAVGYGGFFFNGQVYLIADNIHKGNAEGARRLLREEIGHGLLRTPEGLKLLSEVLKQGKLNLTKSERQALLAKGYKEHQLLDEFIAQSARENRSWWKKLVDKFRELLSKAGLKLSNAETARILLRQIKANNLKSEAAKTAVAPGMADKSAAEIERINREINELSDKPKRSTAESARLRQLEEELGQEDLFETSVKPAESDTEAKRKQQASEIARRQGSRLVAGEIADQGGLFDSPKGEVKQDDMFAAPPATEKKRGPATDLFGDLAPGAADEGGDVESGTTEERRAKFRRAQVLGLPIGALYEVQQMAPIIENVRQTVFDSRDDVTPERTDEANNLVRLLTDDRTKSIGARELFEQLGGEGDATLQILHNELADYAVKMTMEGDQSLARFIVENWGKLAKHLDGDGLSEDARVMRAVQESKAYRIFKLVGLQLAESRKSARAATKVDENLWNQLIEGLSRIAIDRKTLESEVLALPVGNGQTLGEVLQPVIDAATNPETSARQLQTELGLELEESRKKIEKQAKQLANKYELTVFPGKGKPNIVIQTIRDFLAKAPATENRPEADVPVNAKLTVDELASRLVEIGVSPETAARLSYDVYEKRERNWQEARLKAQKRTAERGSIWSLVQDILQSPYLSQKSEAWRTQMAENWFMRNGLSRDQAQAAAKNFNTIFEAKMLDAGEEVAKKILSGKTDARNMQDIIKGIRSGLLDPNRSWSDFVAERDGWKPVSEAQFKKLAELELKAGDKELSPQEFNAIEEEMMAIMRHVGPKNTDGMYWRRLSEGFVSSLLSGIRTLSVQASPVIAAIRDYPIAALRDPKNAFNYMKAIYNAARNVFAAEFKYAWKRDAYGYHLETLDRQHKELKRWWEQLEQEYKTAKNPAQKGWVRVRQLYAAQQYVSRVLSTIDQSMMAATREVKLAYYTSEALRSAGISTSKIATLIEAVTEARDGEYQKALADGVPEDTARVRANARVDRAVWEFVNNMTGTAGNGTLANQVLKSAENDVYSVVGRKANGVKEEDEGMLSRWSGMKRLMTAISQIRSEGGSPAIIAVALSGFVNVPFRTMMYFSQFGPYGLLRSGIDAFRKSRGLETYWKQTYATELQAKQRFYEAVAGTAVMALASAWATGHTTADDDAEDDDKFGIYFTGSGPSKKELRDQWLKAGWRPYSVVMVIDGVKVKIPITRVGEALMFPFILPAALDDVAWKKKERKIAGRPDAPPISQMLGSMVGSAMYMTGQKGMMQGVVQLAQAAQGGQGVLKSTAKIAGGTLSASVMPFKQLVNSFSEMFVGQLDQSSASALVAAQFPVIGLPWQKKSVNRFGDEIGDRSWFGILERTGIPVAFKLPDSSQNRELYTMLVDKGAAAPQLRRSVLEEKYGALTNEQFEDFATKSGNLLKQTVVARLGEVKRMQPEEVQSFLEKSAKQSDKMATAALGLEPVKEPEKKSESKSTAAIEPFPSAPQASQSPVSSPAASRAPRFGGSMRSRLSGRRGLSSFRTPRLRRRTGRSFRSSLRRAGSGMRRRIY